MSSKRPNVLGIELSGSIGEAWAQHEYRLNNDPDFSGHKFAGTAPNSTFERLSEIERVLIPDTYITGSARQENEILTIGGTKGVLLTAEHATKQRRLNQSTGARDIKGADSGTGALCQAVAQDTANFGLIAVGRQTGDANWDESHPFKDAMREIIVRKNTVSHLALHGISRAHAACFDDEKGFAVMLGIGEDPSEATQTLVYDYLVPLAKDCDLRLGVNQPFIKFNPDNRSPLFNADGTVAREVFIGPEYTTRGFSQAEARKLGKDAVFSAVQIELSSTIRPRRILVEQFPTLRDAEIGTHLGYTFVRKAAESVELL
jgi:hypothetical protein